MAENFGIVVKCTAANSPWSNGSCERHNATLTETYLKLLAFNSLHLTKSVLIKYACFAKNTFLNNHGYSPQQLIFGENPNIPTVLNATTPALENVTTSQLLRDHIVALASSRQQYLASESSDRFKRALKSKTCIYGGPFVNGQPVLYRKRTADTWHGPAVVLGTESRTVVLKHAGNVLRVHESRVRGLSPSQENQEASDISPICTQEQTNESGDEVESGTIDSLIPQDHQETMEADEIQAMRISTSTCVADEVSGASQTALGSRLPKKNETIRFKTVSDYSSGKDYEDTVIGRAGKAGGKHKDWLNVRYTSPEELDGEVGAVDFGGDIQSWSYFDNPEALLATEFDEFNPAKLDEIESWKHHDVFEIVPDTGQQRVTTRWVLTVKDNGRKKARLVARGFEEKDNVELMDSPTCTKESLRLLFLLLASNSKWFSQVIDVKTAFLQGEALTREVYLMPPKEFSQPGTLWKLNKCVRLSGCFSTLVLEGEKGTHVIGFQILDCRLLFLLLLQRELP